MVKILFIVEKPCEPISRKLEGVYKAAGELGWCVIPIDFGRFRGHLEKGLKHLQPDGCIVDCSQLTKEFDLDVFRPYPTVFIDRDPKMPPDDAPNIRVDDESIVDIAFRELAASHPVSWAYVGYGAEERWSRNRAELLGGRLGREGIELHVFDRHWLRQSLDTACRELADWLTKLPKPCALFAANDETAATVFTAAANAKLKIPDDLSIVSTDNDLFLCENMTPTLSSVGLDFIRCGLMAIGCLKQLIDGKKPPNALLEYGALELTRRQSSFRPPCRYQQISELVEFIRKDACHGITAADVLARATGSRRSIETRFRQMTGVSIREMILDTRLEAVKYYLRRPYMSIAPIANICGWSSESHLKRYFKQRTGLTMTGWRRKAAT